MCGGSRLTASLADVAATRRALIGAVHHACVSALTWARYAVSTGPWWTDYNPEGVRSNRDRSAQIGQRETKGNVPRRLHSGASEPAMAGDEPSAEMAFLTTNRESRSMGVIKIGDFER
jgi:hypothetical protein